MHENLSINLKIDGQTISKSRIYRILDSRVHTYSLVTALSITCNIVLSSGGYISSYLPAI